MPEVNGVLNGQIIVPNLMVNHHTFPFEWYFWDTPCFQTHPYEISRVAKSIAQFIPGDILEAPEFTGRKWGTPKADDSVQLDVHPHIRNPSPIYGHWSPKMVSCVVFFHHWCLKSNGPPFRKDMGCSVVGSAGTAAGLEAVVKAGVDLAVNHRRWDWGCWAGGPGGWWVLGPSPQKSLGDGVFFEGFFHGTAVCPPQLHPPRIARWHQKLIAGY